MKQMSKKWIERLALKSGKALVLASALMLGLQHPQAHASDEPVLVKTMVTPEISEGITRTFFGEISASQSVDLGFQVAGRVVELNAPEGDVIPKGSILAKLDRRPFQIEVDRAKLALTQEERKLARYEKLKGKTISEVQVQDARTNVEMARAVLENAEYSLEQTILTAPFDAVVASRSVSNFSTVAAGTQIVRLHDLSEVRVDIEVSEVLIQNLGENPKMRLHARLPGSNATYPLTFKEVNAETSQVGQTFRVTLTMQIPNTRLLLPGASVTVTAVFLDQSEGVEIHPSAIAVDPKGKTSVFLVRGENGVLTASQTPVDLSVASSGAIAITPPLPAGTEIVVGGVNTLKDGQAIRRFVADFD